MRTLLMALACLLFAYAGAEAQVCKARTAVRHRVVHHTTQPAATTETTTAVSCKLVPYQACSINPDRRSVTCYQTTDLDNLTPLNGDRVTYGSTGSIPGQIEQPAMKTIIIKGDVKTNYCRRDNNLKATVCNYDDERLYRDPFGYYYYR